MNLIREVNESLGMTVLLVTHERPLAERYAGRLVVMADGKLASQTEDSEGARR